MQIDIEIRNQKISNEEIHLGHKKSAYAPVILDSVIENSRLIIHGNIKAVIHNVRFVNCTIEFKNASFILNSVQFVGCRFKGKVKDGVIGSPPLEEKDIKPEIVNCDFSEVQIQLLCFKAGLKPETCNWPVWPIVLFEKTKENLQELRSLDLPSKVLRLLSTRVLGEINYFVFDFSKYECDVDYVYNLVSKCSHVKNN